MPLWASVNEEGSAETMDGGGGDRSGVGLGGGGMDLGEARAPVALENRRQAPWRLDRGGPRAVGRRLGRSSLCKSRLISEPRTFAGPDNGSFALAVYVTARASRPCTERMTQPSPGQKGWLAPSRTVVSPCPQSPSHANPNRPHTIIPIRPGSSPVVLRLSPAASSPRLCLPPPCNLHDAQRLAVPTRQRQGEF